jgi:hypothetical protein
MDALVEISNNLSLNTPEWALKVTHEMITQWKKVGKAYNLDVSLPPFIIRLDVKMQDMEVDEEREEGKISVQVEPQPPYYVEFPEGALDEALVGEEGFKPFVKEFWPTIIKDYISYDRTIGFIFVCESNMVDTSVGDEGKTALVAQYQGYGDLTTTFYQCFEVGESNNLVFDDIKVLPVVGVSQVLGSLSGLFERRLEKDIVN